MGLILDGVGASQHIDSTGEILLIDGVDISSFNDGTGVLNFEHENSRPDDIVGRILYGKKILSESDCETDRQLYFWNKVKVPYIYIIGELFDEQGHPGAVALASMMSYCRNKKEKMILGYSIEGNTTERSGMYLKRAVARKLAITVKPANKSCVADILDTIPNIKKAFGDDKYKPLAKSMQVEIDPDFALQSVARNPTIKEQNQLLEDSILDLLEFSMLVKALDAGMPTGAPGTLTQGAALQTSSDKPKKLSSMAKAQILSIIRDKWDRKQPLEEFIKSELKDLGPSFLEHFNEVKDDLSLMKSRKIASYRSTVAYIPHTLDQKRLVDGLKNDLKDDNSPTTQKNKYGIKVYTKRGHNAENMMMFNSERAVAYYNIARDFFGLGDLVPVTSCYLDPKDKKIHHATAVVQDAITGFKHPHKYDELINNAARTGLLHKIALMDYILGHNNRHIDNLVFSIDNTPKLLSNDHAFEDVPNEPDYWHLIEPINQITDFGIKQWLGTLDSEALYGMIRLHAFPKHMAAQVKERLDALKDRFKYSRNILELYRGE